MVCAHRGDDCVICMAEPFSVERRRLMRMLGAKVIVTPKAGKGTGMVRKAEELCAKNGWFLCARPRGARSLGDTRFCVRPPVRERGQARSRAE